MEKGCPLPSETSFSFGGMGGKMLLKNKPQWKPPRCPRTDEWINATDKHVPRDGMSLSLIKGGRRATCHCMDEPQGIVLGDINQSQKDKYGVIPLT